MILSKSIDIIAGSCSVESKDESIRQADYLHKHNINKMRFMVWKPRTNPESYQGIGVDGLEFILNIVDKYPNFFTFTTEVMSQRQVDVINRFSNQYGIPFIYQVGTRNAQNFELLKYIATMENQNILYKRGMSMTIQEYIEGSKYLNPMKNNILLCLRGIRTFETETRNTSDIDAVCILKSRFEFAENLHYKVYFDPSHATGHRKYIHPLALSAIIAGADGLEVEIHSNPDEAMSDAKQTISFDDMTKLLSQIQKLYYAFDY